jgi:hypothetical protein
MGAPRQDGAFRPVDGKPVLQKRGRVWEVPNAEERHRAIARSYVESPEKTLIVSPDNASRRELNSAVRQELKVNGTAAAEDHSFRVVVQRQDHPESLVPIESIYSRIVPLWCIAMTILAGGYRCPLLIICPVTGESDSSQLALEKEKIGEGLLRRTANTTRVRGVCGPNWHPLGKARPNKGSSRIEREVTKNP